MTRDALIAGWVVVFGSLLAPRGHAHVGHTITRAERTLKLDASEEATRFVVSITLGRDEGLRVMEEADADRDSLVSEAESAAYLDTWARGLRESEIVVEVDGEPVACEVRDGFFDPLGPVRPTEVTLEMVVHIPTTSRQHRVVVRDRMVRRDVFERTDVLFAAHDGAELAGSGVGPPDPRSSMREGVLDAAPDTEGLVWAEVSYPDRPTPWPGAALLSALGAVAAVALGLVWWRTAHRGGSS